MEKRVGIADVARAASVSVTTVSHALSGRGQVSAPTKRRVQEAAAQLGYSPNRIASALRRRRSGLIGLVSDEIATTPFAGRIILGAQDAAADRGLLLMLANSNLDDAVERTQIAALLAQQVDAVVYAKMFHQRVEVPESLRSVPTVLVDAADGAGAYPSFVPDEEAIGRAAAQRLLAAGHRRVAHLTITAPTPAAEGRLRGFRGVLRAAGLTPEVVRARGLADSAAGREAFDGLRTGAAPVTAVFCFNDQMAFGVYQSARDRGIDIPTELSVVGVDNLELIAAEMRPGLTTIALPHYELGRRAVALVSELVDAGSDQVPPARTVRLRGRLVERGSVAPPRRA